MTMFKIVNSRKVFRITKVLKLFIYYINPYLFSFYFAACGVYLVNPTISFYQLMTELDS